MSPTQILIDIDPTILRVGPAVLTATGLSIGLALIIALLISVPGLRQRGIPERVLHDVALRSIPFGLVGGRIFHVADNWTYYGVHPLSIIEPGGFSLDGVLLFGGLIALRFLRKRDISVGQFFDALAPGLFGAMIVGSFGSLISGDLLGRPAQTFLAVKYISPYSFDQRGVFVYPVAAYVILWFVVGGLLCRFLARRRLPSGALAAFAILWLGIGQLWQEIFRSAPTDWFGLSQGQTFGLILVLIAVFAIIRQAVRHKACTHPERAAQLTR